MSEKKDIFADLLAPKKQDVLKMSLLERQKLMGQSGGGGGTGNWSGLDLLGGSVSKNNSSSNISIGGSYGVLAASSVSGASHSSGQDLDSLFAVFDQPKPAVKLATPPIKKQELVPQRPEPRKMGLRKNSSYEKPVSLANSSLDDFPKRFNDTSLRNNSVSRFSEQDYDEIPSRPAKFKAQPSSNRSNKDVHLLLDDMIKPADNLNQVVNELSQELFSGASSLFNKSKTALNKNIEKYQAQRKAGVDGSPTWMHQQDKYMKKKQWDFGDEPVIDFDGSILQELEYSGNSRTGLFKDEHFPSETAPPAKPSRPARQAKPMPKPVAKPVAVTKEVETLNIFEDLPVKSSLEGAAGNASDPFVDEASLRKIREYQKSGTSFFQKGDFTSALVNYQDMSKLVPPGHSLHILVYSNLATTYLRLGDTKNALEAADQGIGLSSSRSLADKIDGGKLVKEFWVKLVTRKAETLEHLERYSEALESWQVVLENGGATKSAIDSKRRCLQAINPSPTVKPRPARRPAQYSNKAVNRVKANNAKAEKLEQEKFDLHDQVENKINQWKHGKEDNIRALLVSLDQILWPEANWKSVNLTDLVVDKKVKINYMKAVAKTHPDKINKDATTEQQLIAQSVFVTINKAWDIFKEKNNMK